MGNGQNPQILIFAEEVKIPLINFVGRTNSPLLKNTYSINRNEIHLKVKEKNLLLLELTSFLKGLGVEEG